MRIWKSAGNCVQGRAHIKNDTPCQDKIAKYIDHSIQIISLADGAGSCRLSHIGADLVTSRICEFVKDYFDEIIKLKEEEIPPRIASDIKNILLSESHNLGCDIKDLSSTLLFVAVKGECYLAGSLGDGIIGILRKNNTLEVLSHPDNGEYLNETYFTTSSQSEKHLRIYKGNLEDIIGFIIMSDGAGESLYNRKDKFLSSVCTQILEWLDDNLSEDVSEALYDNLKNILRNKTTDDCSINVLKKVSTTASKLNEMPRELQREMLNVKHNGVYLNNQLTILNAIESGSRTTSNIVESTDISKKTVYKHLNSLELKSIISRNGTSIDVKE